MKVVKTINNNLVRSYEKGTEVLVMGSGIGFQKKPGDEIDSSRIEKVYRISDQGIESKLAQIVDQIPAEHLRVANLIIDYARSVLSLPLSDRIYVDLTDHLSFAIERYEKGMTLRNPLLWDIRKFYNSEYLVGCEALEMINRELGISLPEDEAGFIALHLVEASTGETSSEVEQNMDLISHILLLIRYYFQIELDESTLAYERFMVHLKFFVERAVSGTLKEDDDSLYQQMRKTYTEEFACADKIRNYLLAEKGIEVPRSETVYLAIHIYRVVHQ